MKLLDSNLMLIESNHDVDMLNAGKYPYPLKRRILSKKGHISNVAAAEAIVIALSYNAPLGHVILGHLSQDNNTPELAYETVKGILEENDIVVGEDISLDLAYRNRVGKLYRIE
jgi:phosphoribosyl 1,2-cyclic phosphodiesterase